jgi:MATE family multidrug resistance protein
LGWLIGRELTTSALAIVVVINLTNIILDLIFVTVLGMTSSGVALASVFAEYAGLLLGLCIVYRQSVRLSWIRLKHAISNLIEQRQQLGLHADFMIRTWCLIFCFAFFTNQSAKAGDLILAANMVLLNFYTLTAYVLDGFANATEVLSGKAVGLKNKKMLGESLFYTGLWALICACLFSLSYFVFGQHLIHLMTSLEAVQLTADTFLIWCIIGPVIGVASYVLDGLFVGATQGKAIRNTMLFSALCCYLPAWYLLQGWGNHGLWAAMLIFLAARALSQAMYLPSIFRKLG